MMHHPDLFISHSAEKGRGVFAGSQIEEGDIIEICPVIVLPKKDKEKIHDTFLHDYYFLWGTDLDQVAISLGYGSLYNHSKNPNATYEYNYEDESITIICKDRILAGAEIYIDYNEGEEQGVRMWF